MGRKTRASIILVLTTLIVLVITPSVASAAAVNSGFSAQYDLTNPNQKLYISIQPSLHTYYSNLTHRIVHDSDYAKLVTPTAVQSIADNLLNLTQGTPNSDEQFANLVLTVVHQIPYNITGAKYPIETLQDNHGDCGALSILAASIMKAGGLDVVLIKYTGIDPPHMNVGVHLQNAPVYHSVWLSPTSFEYNNKTYWTAEATPQVNWQVGDQSYSMAAAVTTIIPLEKCPTASPGQVASSIGAPPTPTDISLNISQQPTNLTDKRRALLISGSIQPANAGSNVTLFINENNTFTQYFSAVTDKSGAYGFVWNITRDGTYYIMASLCANGTYAGVDSSPQVVFIGPQSLLQFQSDTYNYIVGVPFGDIAIRPFIGIDNFLKLPLGTNQTNLSLSYSFSVLNTGNEESPFNPVTVEIPSHQYTVDDRRGRSQTVDVPPETRTVPTNIPPGMTPMALPNDFNQTINNNFCLIIQKDSDGNYSLNVKGLDGYDLSSIREGNQTGAFLNATQNVQQSTWYRVSTTITANGINADLQKEDDASLGNVLAAGNTQSNKQLVLLLANNVDSAVVIKDFKVQTASDSTPAPQTPSSTPEETPGATIPFALICELGVVALVFTVAAIYMKTRKLDR